LYADIPEVYQGFAAAGTTVSSSVTIAVGCHPSTLCWALRITLIPAWLAGYFYNGCQNFVPVPTHVRCMTDKLYHLVSIAN